MDLIDGVVIVLVVLAVASRFTKFKLPSDPRNRATRRADLDAFRNRPLVRDDAPHIVDITAQTEATRARKPSQKELQDAAKNLSGLPKIKLLEPGFDEAVFLESARTLYLRYYTCWNAKDEDGLRQICSPKMYDRLLTELHDDTLGQTVLVDAITAARLINGRVLGRTAIVEVEFEATQREGTRKLKASPRTMRSCWVLARPLGSEDPNWELQNITNKADA